MSRTSNDPAENRRIDSWKEIATFFGRDERTVKRWEKTRSLPVHRIPGSKRGGVFAYPHELTVWLNATPPEIHNATPPEHNANPPEIDNAEVEPLGSPLHASPDHAAKVHPRSAAPDDAAANLRRRWLTRTVWPLALAGGALCLACFIRFAYRPMDEIDSRPVVSRALVRHVRNAEAEEHYLRGRYDWNRRTSDSLNRAVDEFTQAIVHDPSDARAYAGLADTYDLMREYTSMPASEAYPRAIAAAAKAVALDDSLSEAHRALAFGEFYWNWNIPGALKEYKRAIQLDPDDVEAHHWYATALLTLGSFDTSFSEIEQARKLDPASPSILADRGLILYEAGDHAGGIAALQELEQDEPQFLSPPRYLAELFLEQKDYPDFVAQSGRAAAISKDTEEISISEAARLGWSAGGEHGMLQDMERAQQTVFEKGQSSGFQLAYTCLLLGWNKRAMQYLQAAFSAHDPNLFTVNRGVFEQSLRGDPEFEQLKIKLQAYRRSS